MKNLNQLTGKQRRRHLRFVRLVITRDQNYRGTWVRGEASFRMVERLHKAGLITAYISKWAWGGGSRPFRELSVVPFGFPSNGEPKLPGQPK